MSLPKRFLATVLTLLGTVFSSHVLGNIPTASSQNNNEILNRVTRIQGALEQKKDSNYPLPEGEKLGWYNFPDWPNWGDWRDWRDWRDWNRY